MDLNKLTAAPWRECLCDNCGCPIEPEADHEFICLARNAFDVMMRRQWHAWPDSKLFGDELRIVWYVCAPQVPKEHCGPCDNPFVALVEADKWYSENIEKNSPKD